MASSIKNAAKAKTKGPKKAPTMESVDTPFSECKAKDKMKCRFHGLKAFELNMDAVLNGLGYKGSKSVGKMMGGKGFEMVLPSSAEVTPEFLEGMANKAKEIGLETSYEGKNDAGGHEFICKLAKKSKKKTPSSKELFAGLDDGLGEIDEAMSLADDILHREEIEEEDDIGEAGSEDGELAEALLEADELMHREEVEGDEPKEIPLEDYVGWVKKFFDGIDNKEAVAKEWKALAEKGTWYGATPAEELLQEAKEAYLEKDPKMGHPVTKALVGKINSLLGIEDSADEGKEAKGEGDVEVKEPTEEDWDEAYKIFANFSQANGWFWVPLTKEQIISNLKNGDWYNDHKLFVMANQQHYKDLIGAVAAAKGKGSPIVKAMVAAYKSHPLYDMSGLEEYEGGGNIEASAAKVPSDEEFQKAVKALKEEGYDHDGMQPLAMLKTANYVDTAGHAEPLMGMLYSYKVWINYIAEKLGSSHPVVKHVLSQFVSHPAGYNYNGLTGLMEDTGITKENAKYIEFKKDGGTKVVEPKKPAVAEEVKAEAKTSEEKPYVPAETFAIVSKDLLKPLEHDDTKFPAKITQDELEKAIAGGKKAGGHGGLNTRIIEIDGKKYVCKSGSGKKSKIIKNGYTADMGYRAGGIYAPDAKLYEFGDGKTYKLSEFVSGKRLIDVWKEADESKRNEIRGELLQGFPLDVLFSNHDVLGTSPEESQTVTITGEDGKPQKTHVAFDNIILGDDGHAYRIDNDGAFAMTGTGGIKSSSGGAYTAKVEFEHWDNWEDRQWIDDFRTMRRNEKNLGMFDRYSTADIFLSASKVNFDAMEKSFEANEPLRKALMKPLFEMKQMAGYAHGAEVAGYKNQKGMTWTDSSGKKQGIESDPLSIALDAIYNGHKGGIRPFLQKKVSWMDAGWLGYSGGGAAYVPKPFAKPEPPEPLPPKKGLDMALEVLEGVKTIAYHVKQGDFKPNEGRIKRALAAKPYLEVVAAAGNEKAKGLLSAIGKIEESAKGGYKKALTFETSDGMFDVKGLSLLVDDDGIEKYNKSIKPIHDKWESEHKGWVKEKAEWDAEEIEKAKKAGAAPTKNFQTYEDMLVTANYDTNGIQQGGGNPSVNHESKSAQKGTSFSYKACLKKVRQYAMMGLSLDDMDFSNSDKTYYNGNVANGGHHVSGGDGVGNYKKAIQFYRDNPENFKKDMQAYAVHKGMMVICHSNMDNPAIDHDLLTCFVMRGEHKEAWGNDGAGSPTETGIIKPYPIDSSSSACINATGHFGSKKIGWKLPIWRITDNFMIGSGSEEEICINPINIPYPPMYFADTSGGWEACMKKYNEQEAVKKVDKKLGKKAEI